MIKATASPALSSETIPQVPPMAQENAIIVVATVRHVQAKFLVVFVNQLTTLTMKPNV